jgi:hypothetical protein
VARCNICQQQPYIGLITVQPENFIFNISGYPTQQSGLAGLPGAHKNYGFIIIQPKFDFFA